MDRKLVVLALAALCLAAPLLGEDGFFESARESAKQRQVLDLANLYWTSQPTHDFAQFLASVRDDVRVDTTVTDPTLGKAAFTNSLNFIGRVVYDVASIDSVSCFVSVNKPSDLEDPRGEAPRWAVHCETTKTLVHLFTRERVTGTWTTKMFFDKDRKLYYMKEYIAENAVRFLFKEQGQNNGGFYVCALIEAVCKIGNNITIHFGQDEHGTPLSCFQRYESLPFSRQQDLIESRGAYKLCYQLVSAQFLYNPSPAVIPFLCGAFSAVPDPVINAIGLGCWDPNYFNN